MGAEKLGCVDPVVAGIVNPQRYLCALGRVTFRIENQGSQVNRLAWLIDRFIRLKPRY
jgi:hypothetical protein